MAQEKITQTAKRKKEVLQPMVMEGGKPQPKPRFLDIVMEIYVRIGGILGVTFAAGAFLLICAIAFRLFYSTTHGFLFMAIAAGSTLVLASTVAISTFFSVSLLWLPLLVGLCTIGPGVAHLALRIRDSLFGP